MGGNKNMAVWDLQAGREIMEMGERDEKKKLESTEMEERRSHTR